MVQISLLRLTFQWYKVKLGLCCPAKASHAPYGLGWRSSVVEVPGLLQEQQIFQNKLSALYVKHFILYYRFTPFFTQEIELYFLGSVFPHLHSVYWGFPFLHLQERKVTWETCFQIGTFLLPLSSFQMIAFRRICFLFKVKPAFVSQKSWQF